MTDSSATPPGHRSGFVAVVGRPNVGKSTLMNAFLGQKIAAVSPKPQTTRQRQLGILTAPGHQAVFVDTPGFHTPKYKLGEYMNETAKRSLAEADVILFIADVTRPPNEEDRQLAEIIRHRQGKASVLLALNKADALPPAQVIPHSDAYRALIPEADWLLVSAARGDNRDELLRRVVDALPEGPRYYEEDEVTDLWTRDIAADLIREAALNELRNEVPHGIAVRIDEFAERSAQSTYVAATLLVERESHKPIVIGKGGSMLKAIGTAARKEIEALTGTGVFLELRVKVAENWRDNERELKRLGFEPPEA